MDTMSLLWYWTDLSELCDKSMLTSDGPDAVTMVLAINNNLMISQNNMAACLMNIHHVSVDV